MWGGGTPHTVAGFLAELEDELVRVLGQGHTGGGVCMWTKKREYSAWVTKKTYSNYEPDFTRWHVMLRKKAQKYGWIKMGEIFGCIESILCVVF